MGVLFLFFKLYVGLMFGITALLFYPVLRVLMLRKEWHRFTFPVFVVWSNFLRFLTFYYIKKDVAEPLPKGPFVIVSNHASYLDIFLMHSIFSKHPFLFLGKSEILSYPILRRYFKGLHIPVFRDNKLKAAKSLIIAKKAMEKGWSLVIFPEGTIPDENKPKMIPFKDGAFRLAKDANMGILPVTFINNHKLFSDPMDWFGSTRPGISRIEIHAFLSPEKTSSMSVQELSQYCFRVIEQPIMESQPQLFKAD